MLLEKLLVPPLHQHVEAKIPPVELNQRVAGSRRRDARRQKHLAANLLAQITGVLHGIVQMYLLQAMKALALSRPLEVQRQRRLVIQGSKTAQTAFEMN